MTRHSPVRYVLGAVTAVVLTACGGGTSVDETAAEAGISSQQQTDGGQAAQADSQTGSADSGGQPGGPGGDPGGNGGDAQAQGNPGAPGDVAVFEEAGVTYSVLRDDAATKCADGACHLAPPVVLDGNPDDVGGIDECTIEDKSDILYDPPGDGDVFPRGATVTAQVHCTSEDTSGDLTDPGNSDSGNPAGESSAGESSAAADQSQG